jgi:hypothetical protein
VSPGAETWVYKAPTSGAPAWKRRGVTDLPPYSPSTPPPPPPVDPGTPNPPTPPTPPTGPDSVLLPFNLEAVRAPMAASSRKCWAHYFVTFPISFDNATDYYKDRYNPGAPNMPAADIPFEGQTRDKPLLAMTRPLKRPEADWKIRDRADEVRQAISVGIDGWTPDILQVVQAGAGRERWDQLVETMAAVNQVANPNFKIVPMFDSLASAVKDPDIVADHALLMAKDPSAFKFPTGEYPIAPYAPERAPNNTSTGAVQFWTDMLAAVRAGGVVPRFWPCFLDAWTGATCAPAFEGISYGFSRWGDRSPTAVTANSVNNRLAPPTSRNGSYRQTATGLPAGSGKPWMHPVAFGDTRPNQGNYFESRHFDTLVGSWTAAIDGNAEWVQIPTWSDMAEHANIQPTRNHGWVFLDVSAYFLARWKLGYFPTIVRDAVYVAHRTQLLSGTTYTGRATRVQTPRAGETPRDEVGAACFLTEPATVNITAGGVTTSVAAPAGFSVQRAPLKLGSVSVEAVRGGVAVSAVVSPHKVVASRVADDWNYYAAGSLR